MPHTTFFYSPIALEPICLNPLNVQLNPICYLLALLGAHHILQVSRIKINEKLVAAQLTADILNGMNHTKL
jgi:uncharacterized membrane protein